MFRMLFPYAKSAQWASFDLNFAGNFFARRSVSVLWFGRKLAQENGQNEGRWGQKGFVVFTVKP